MPNGDTDTLTAPATAMPSPAFAPSPGLSPEAQTALQLRLASATRGTMPMQPWESQGLSTLSAAQQDAPDIQSAEKAVAAAIRFQGVRMYQADLATGMAHDQALARNAPMMFYQSPGTAGPMTSAAMGQQSPQAAIAARQQATQAAIAQRQQAGIAARQAAATAAAAAKETPEQKRQAALEQVEFSHAAQRYSAARTALAKVDTDSNVPNPQDKLARKQDLLREADSARKDMMRIRRLSPPGAPMPRALAGGAAPAAGPAARIRVKSPEGKTGSIPADKLEAAKKAGYTVIEEAAGPSEE